VGEGGRHPTEERQLLHPRSFVPLDEQGAARRIEGAGDIADLVEALGLLGDPKSREPVKKVAEASLRRPEILSRAALALTMLSDRTVVPWLMNTLKTARHSMHVQAAVAQALGHIGRDPEAEALVEILQSRKRGDYVKSYAAVALGLLGEISERPWYSYLSVDINYLASMETLVGGSMGVLDLL